MRTRLFLTLAGAVVLVTLAGCETIRLGRPLAVSAEAVTTEGGSGSRTHVTDQALPAPLVQAWRYDAEGGFGPAAVLAGADWVLVGNRNGEVHIVDLEQGRGYGKAELGEAIEGAPVLVGGGLLIVPFVAGGSGLLAYDVVNGKTLWRLRDTYHASGLLIADEVLIAAAMDGTVRGLDPETGTEHWAIRPDSRSSFIATPTDLGDGRVALVDDRGQVTTLNPTTGRVLWTARVEAPVQETATAADGERLIIPTTRGRLVALDARTGAVAWTHQAAASTARFATAAASGNRVVVGASDGLVRSLDAQTGEVQWTASFDGNIAAAPLIAGDLVYVGTLGSILAALDLETGARVWETTLPGRVKSAMVATDETLIVLAEPRHIYAFRPQTTLADATN